MDQHREERVMLTAGGRAMLAERLRQLVEDILPGMRPLLVEEERDERVVADFERLTAEHDQLALVLGTAGDVDEDALGPVISLGSRVTVRGPDGQERTVRIVDPAEAFLDGERISNSSPLARALLGHVEGDECRVEAPAGPWTAVVRGVGATA